jgi:sugar transferase (PEP-CTERM/EpsH1 system associated)
MMDILYVTSNLPFPPTDGPRIRLFSFIRSLAQRHHISVLSFLRTTEDAHAVEALRAYCADVQVIRRKPGYSPWRLVRGLLGPTAFGVINYYDPDMASLIKKLMRQRSLNIVQAEGIQMAQYCLNLSCSTIIDLHNIESRVMKRFAKVEPNPLKRAYAEVTWRKLVHYEQKVYSRFSHCLTCSEEDQKVVGEWAGTERVTVIPNGVDVKQYSLDGHSSEPGDRLVFVGRMDYHANVDGVKWFCKEILPYIRSRRPTVVFQIVGVHPTKQILQLARPDQVEVTGPVDDIRPYLRQAKVVVAPLRVGGGTRFKILEALAMGKAVVSTSVGSEGIAVTSGHELLIADSPREFADQVIRALEGDELRLRLGLLGRRLVEDRYSWDATCRRLEDVYSSLNVNHGKQGAVRFSL